MSERAVSGAAVARKREQRGFFNSPWFVILVGQVALTVAFFGIWEILVRTGVLRVYLYGLPSGIWTRFWALLWDGTLLRDTAVTGFKSVVGFAIGSFTGSLIGLGLWLTPTLALVLRPFIVAVNGLPKIALAPLIIVWFGIDMESKIAIAAIITFIVSLMTAYSGAMEVDQDLVRLMRSLGATPRQTFFKVVVPLHHSLDRIRAQAKCRLRADRSGGRRIYRGQGRARLSGLLFRNALRLECRVGWPVRVDGTCARARLRGDAARTPLPMELRQQCHLSI